MLEGGSGLGLMKAGAKVSERTCVACRKKAARTELLRFVLQGEDGTEVLSFDELRCRPGRGVWTCSSAECFEKALAKGQLLRGLRAHKAARQVAQSDEVVHELRESVELYVKKI